MEIISLLALLFMTLPLLYLILLAIASVRSVPLPDLCEQPLHRFVIAIPAHNEENVIKTTVENMLSMDYPEDMFSLHVVADHCSDSTGIVARQAGAIVHERNDGLRSGKGSALSWLFQRVLSESVDAVVIFDADTKVKPDFLRIMDSRLTQGNQVIQGQHVIRNPDSGWFPALTWAMFLIDNRFQNQGRANLGWSAKHMGDSICFEAAVLRSMGWGEGLTEDYQLRQRLLLQGIKIAYEPAAIGYGEAPLTWAHARAQRTRWLRGTSDANRQLAWTLLVEGLKRRDVALLDGALQAFLPSYSTLTILCILALLIKSLIIWRVGPCFSRILVGSWIVFAVLLFIYPLIGLILKRAPIKAYLVILSGPAFIIWRTWLALMARIGRKPVKWIRTPHHYQD